MAKMFEFAANRMAMRETEKAYGFEYWNQGKRAYFTEWLPKSQITVEDIEDNGGLDWHEGDVLVSVPMWLARKNGYFERTILKEHRAGCY